MLTAITYLILHGARAWNWALSGAAIGAITLLLLFLANKRLGISTSFENICALGTRIAGGCTSGHGIFGLSNFEKASLVATLSFMAAGIITTNIIYRVIIHL